MTARAPTVYTTPALNLIEPGDFLEYTELDQILNGQQWIINCPQVVICDCFGAPLTSTSTSYVTTPAPYTPGMRSWRVEGSDICGIDGTDATTSMLHDWYVLSWNSDGTTDGTIRLGNDGANDSSELGITLGSTTPTWYGPGAISGLTNSGEETWTLDFKRIAGAGTVYVGAILVVANDP